MNIFNIKIGNGNTDEIVNYITTQKLLNPNFKVIDIGGGVTNWSSNIIDALIDINIPEQQKNNIKYFICDITNPYSWNKILDYIIDNGKFDFSICTHTLEDIMNPGFVCEQLTKISKAGYISMPSKYRELSRCEGDYRGYIHHRWIFDIIDNKLIGYPKLNFIEYVNDFDKIASYEDSKYELSFWWKDYINVNYINNNYMGPSVYHVKQYFKKLLDKTI